MEDINEELVGFKNDEKLLIEKLTTRTMDLDTISIVGMAGIGKTALARKIYNNRDVVYHFHVRAWCSISQIYNVGKLSLEILKQITGDKCVIVDDPRDALRKYLMGKRYLIVLDDIWEVKAWNELQLCLPRYGCESKIMITTRNEELARCMEWDSDSHLLPFLRDEESWELLQRKVFKGENCPLELLRVGQLVAKRCKGLPFLIIVIAGILSKIKRDASLWLEVAHDISSHALEEESLKMIQPSYDRLEDHLKSCLLYMGLFPKGYEIPVSDLLKWWIAEEFVQNIDALELEETSKSCLNDLVNRNLVVVSKRRASGEMKCCVVLDQVREFCLRKIKEEKFMKLIVPYNPYQQRPLDSNEQRLCMYVHDSMRSDSEETESSGKSLGSLEFIVHPEFSISDRKNPFRLLNNLGCIRVLHLLNIYLESSWASTFKSLTHLRYLAIFVKVFDSKWVSHLLHLQTLRVCSSYIMISPAIWKMKRLRHVDISEFPITSEDDEQVINLRTLGLCYMSVADMTPKFWGKFPNLEELRLHIDEFGDLPNYSGSRLMSLEMFPPRLKVLSLSDIFLTDEIVSSIAKLPHLETLKLSEIYFTGGNIWDLNDNVFKMLKVLKLRHVFMTLWICSDESFPKLEALVIKSCSKLEEIPLSFMDILTLRSIKVIDCSDSVGNSAEKIKKEIKELEDYDLLELQVLQKD